MAEGRFPARRLQDSLLPDAERREAGGYLRLRADRVHDDRRALMAALAGAEHAVLSRPRGDLRRSTEQAASRWLLENSAQLAEVPTLTTATLDSHTNNGALEKISSFSGGLAHTSVLASDQELRLAPIARGTPDHRLLTGDARTRTALEVVRARRSDDFTRFDGNLNSIADEIGPPRRISATALERWATCPRAYLFADLLGVEHVEQPEQRFEIDPLSRGALIHGILEEFISAALRDGHPFATWSDADHVRLRQIAEQHFRRIERQGQTGRAMLWHIERRRITDELHDTLRHDNTRLANGLKPVAVEDKFTDVEIGLPDGRSLYMRGFIDRIDRDPEGALTVVDYKTGGNDSYKGLSEQNPHDHGKHLQLYVYSQAAVKNRPTPSLHACYWFTRNNTFIGYPITAQVKAAVLAAMSTVVDGIAAGLFPAHPAEKQPYGWVDCWFCRPDGQSNSIGRRQWERKRSHPLLTAYRALSEPGPE
jgi:RecB family exonuclease